ncbi:hypothetical protein CFC21_001991 [Triticum aestivum]|uniref:Uncharacterized protein n=1 Tax=Triticum aestivum TaxID=4565 RepID=A0A3B5XZT5_WHEAT|nr:uncharacterized protein LOC123050065 isoform X1 [Triticum aestivum]KAF6983902.1 hypothetical protein CFC21_001991 [Triticum aestivum]
MKARLSHRQTPPDSSHELADQEDYRVSEEDFCKHLAVLSSRPRPTTIVGPRIDSEQQREVYERLALYRIRASKGTRYLDWEKYCSWFTTYETDEEYLKYFEEISKKIKWIKCYMKFERGSPEWIEMEARGFWQAVEIAVDFPHMSFDLALTAYTDHIFNTRFDYFDHEEIDPLLFEIWKRLTKQKITFRQALDQVQQENMFPRQEKCIQFVLDNTSIYTRLQSTFDTCVEDISDETPEDEGRRLITMAVSSKLHKEKTWNEYIMRKIEIAKHIGLDLQATCIRILRPRRMWTLVVEQNIVRCPDAPGHGQ